MPKVISTEIEKAIKRDVLNGKSVREIGKKYKVSIGFVSKLRQKISEVTEKNKGGRQPKLNPHTKRIVRRLLVSGAVENATEANKVLREAHQINVSNQTIRRCLKESGMKAKTKVKKPLLSAKHRATRLKFAKEHADWSAEQWRLVTWSDETKINRLGSDGRVWSWYDTKVGITSRNIQETLKFGGGSLMIWGCFQGEKLGILRKVNGIMKSDQYIDILRDSYLPSLEIFGCEPGDTIFMQDNDPKHKAKVTMKWLQEQNIKCLDWPPQSPDLNPIENLWNILKKKIIMRTPVPQNLEELWAVTNEEWSKIDKSILRNLINSIPKRLKLVIKAKGGHIKY